MAPPSSSHLLLCFTAAFLFSTAAAITILISPSSTGTTTTANFHKILSHLASSSIARALQLKSSTHSSASIYTASLVETPLFLGSYAGT
ncbi:hypothetical protein LINPERHAP1_LOCUS37210 [Linum perenne]